DRRRRLTPGLKSGSLNHLTFWAMIGSGKPRWNAIRQSSLRRITSDANSRERPPRLWLTDPPHEDVDDSPPGDRVDEPPQFSPWLCSACVYWPSDRLSRSPVSSADALRYN